ncbi:sarcosine oxidase subunit delta [Oceanibaculum indicum]|uniref:Sarcosine oxidase subunit delta n=1 Tax=Oceanibaculum indicum P24 TaxID=1207063 RepID=K2J0F9_9PROT|nr:sarcosine oxidase subunit delta [Oceanibaculum indicum]EKE76391.1 sarcosine oxidase subunit delta [Oceanibaculum indicum P24]
MLTIPCPWCGDRDVHEFRYGGEAHLKRESRADTLSDAEWADFLFLRTNPKGDHAERWYHAHGCRRWFNAIRNTHTDTVLAVYKPGEKKPEVRK